MQKLLSQVRKCIRDYQMLSPGDRVAVGVSGGKDSVALLRLLAELRDHSAVPFELLAVTLDMGYEEMDFSPVADLCARLQVPYTLRQTQIREIVFDIRKEENPCALCAKLRRGILNETAVALGANKVVISDVSDYKLAMARECGADVAVNVRNENLEEVLDREFGIDGLDVVYECSANSAALNQMMRYGRKGMAFVIVAVYGYKPEIEMGLVQDREYEIYGTLMYLHEDYETAIRLVAEGKVNLKALISKEFPLEQAAQAYQYIEDNRDAVQKVILNV